MAVGSAPGPLRCQRICKAHVFDETFGVNRGFNAEFFLAPPHAVAMEFDLFGERRSSHGVRAAGLAKGSSGWIARARFELGVGRVIGYTDALAQPLRDQVGVSSITADAKLLRMLSLGRTLQNSSRIVVQCGTGGIYVASTHARLLVLIAFFGVASLLPTIGSPLASLAYWNLNVAIAMQTQVNCVPSFAPPTIHAVGDDPKSIAVGDFNGDGKLDLASVNSLSDNVSILLNTGAGTFGTAINFPAGDGPDGIAVGDFNSDGKLDLAIANFFSSGVSILLGSGTGSFAAPSMFAAGSGVQAVVTADFNNDQNLDLAVANGSSNNVSILLGGGNGTFGAPTNFAVGTGPKGLAIRDFNGDGKLDLAVPNVHSDNISILIGTGTGSFGAATNFAVGDQPTSVASGDFNGDGKFDLAATSFVSQSVSILLGTGTGSFGMPSNFPVSGQPRSVAVGEFTGDSNVDLAVASHDVSILVGTGTGGFGPPNNFASSVNGSSFAVVTGDFNTDGKLDLTTLRGFSRGELAVLLNSGPVCGGASAPCDISYGSAANFASGFGDIPVSVTRGDFNADGRVDLAVANAGSNNVSVLIGTGGGGFGSVNLFSVGETPAFITARDLNGDGKLDLATANSRSGNVSILLGTGSGTFGAASNFPTGLGTRSISIEDFNGDGKLDLAAVISGSISILLGTGTGTFGSPTNLLARDTPNSVVAGDFNGDGKIDLAVSNSNSANISMFIGTGNGQFNLSTDFGVGSLPGALALADFNGDSKLDLAVACGGTDNVMILFGTGTGSFSGAVSFVVGDSPSPYSSLVAVDLNGDNILDLAVANYFSNNVWTLSGSGNGVFGQLTSLTVGATGTRTSALAAGDFNGDGRLDLASTNFDEGVLNRNSVSILINNAPCALPPLELMLDLAGPDPAQVAALDSAIFLRDPFAVINNSNFFTPSNDRNTRLVIFVTNLHLAQGETASAVTVNLIDASNQIHDVPAEDVRPVPNFGFTQVVFRLPNNLAVGNCTIRVRAHGRTSNTGVLRIQA